MHGGAKEGLWGPFCSLAHNACPRGRWKVDPGGGKVTWRVKATAGRQTRTHQRGQFEAIQTFSVGLYFKNFFSVFYFEITVDSWEVAKQWTGQSRVPFNQFPSVVIMSRPGSCRGCGAQSPRTVHVLYTPRPRVCACVCVCRSLHCSHLESRGRQHS